MFYSYQTKISEENLNPSADREGTDNGEIVVLSTCQINTCLEPNNSVLQGFWSGQFQFLPAHSSSYYALVYFKHNATKHLRSHVLTDIDLD